MGREMRYRILVMNGNIIVEMSSELSDTVPRDDLKKKKILAKAFPVAKAFPIEFNARGQFSGFSD